MLAPIDTYNVTWTSPSKGINGTMPLGNGDFAGNVWVEPNGDLLILFAKSDAWDEDSINLKLGRLRIKLDPCPFAPGVSFKQTLVLSEAAILITIGDGCAIRIWFDANQNVAWCEVDSQSPVSVHVQAEHWRTEPRKIGTQTGDMFRSLDGKDPYPTIVHPDHFLNDAGDRLIWCHHNLKQNPDAYEVNMHLQGLGGMLDQLPHPLIGRTFGMAVQGDGFSRESNDVLRSKPANRHVLQIVALMRHPSTIAAWRTEIEMFADRAKKIEIGEARKAHGEWWQEFWDRSWLRVTSKDKTRQMYAGWVSRGYALQRFMNAAAGRAGPIKFNGSLFTMGKPDDPDYRQWGGPGFWFQNQRLIYWPMLACGDFDLMDPWLAMYRKQLPLQQHRTSKYFNHEGAHYPETITFWGAEVSAHYGWTPFEKRTSPVAECAYLTYYWSGGIELVLMMCEYVEHTGDVSFARETLLPIAEQITLFYDKHYSRDERGKIRFEPGQSLETWHQAANPLPEIAGLKYTLARLRDLFTPSPGTPGEGWGEGGAVSGANANGPLPSPPPGYREREQFLVDRCLKMQGELPELPTGENEWGEVLKPAESYSIKRNVENPELYAIFPYRLYGLNKPDLDLAKRTFAARLHAQDYCWHQDDIQMALLGLSEQARTNVIERVAGSAYSDSRFPAFWNAFHDWNPDMDHGGVLQMALQLMLMQFDGDAINLLPAWPSEWDCEFKLHAPQQTIVEGKVIDGKVVDLRVTPESRRKDVAITSRHSETAQ